MHCADYKDHKSVSNRAAKLNNPAGLSFRAGIWIDKGDTTAAMADMKPLSLTLKMPICFLHVEE
jgi:hypothetical protein